MHWSYIILSQLWHLFINTNQSPLHLAKSHALIHQQRNMDTHHVQWTHMHTANKETDVSGWVPYHRSENWPPHTDKETEYTLRQHALKHLTQKWMHMLCTLQTHKQTSAHAHTHPHTHWHEHTLQLIGRQVSGEEEKVPVQHIQAEYAISSS